VQRILKEPLLHFLLIGAGLFLFYGWQYDEPDDPAQQIVVSSGRIEQLGNIFAKTWQRPPTRDELQGLIDDFVLEEVYYRRAVGMGLDLDDTIIRRRLRQKLEFLTDDAASLVEPATEELATYLAEHEDVFRESSTYTFQQAYFNLEKHNDPEAFVAEQLVALRSGGGDVGDVSLLPNSFSEATRRAVDGTFGTGFSKELDKLEVGTWQGPVRSGLGIHLVRIETRTPGRLPELEKIRPHVEREWSSEKRREIRKELNAKLLDEFEIVVQWPNETNGNEEAGPELTANDSTADTQ